MSKRAKRVYAYTAVGRSDQPWVRTSGQTKITGTGVIKVGETTRSTARQRIKEQIGTAFPDLEGVEILLDEPAVRDDGTDFTDRDVHAALVAHGIARPAGEWFECTLDDVKVAINRVRTGKDLDGSRTNSYAMRPEQQAAVNLTADYFTAQRSADESARPKFLWNAKMRFGKTFTAYQLAARMSWSKVLVLTYKPAVQTAWRDDLLSHVNFAGWEFIDRDTALDRREQIVDGSAPFVCFASFQDLAQKTADGQVKPHNEAIHLTDWDCIVLDEYHFGAWRDNARDLYDPSDSKLAEVEEPDEWITDEDLGLTTNHVLYLSGTPFRAITNGEFTEEQVFNWTYVDEQSAKAHWDGEPASNPYRELPRMEMFSYEIGDGATAFASDGEFDGFNLTEFFRVKATDSGLKQHEPGAFEFADETAVGEFLEMLRGKLSDQMKLLVQTGQKPPFPYESAQFKSAVEHSVWYLPDVGSCFAMRDLLDAHSYFSGYEVVVAAGSKAGMGADAKPPVEAAIGLTHKRGTSGTITLSCGKLMTGVTVPEWGAILMLRALKSPETYFQAAFRVQSPWAYRDAEGTLDVLKDTCYVFEFDPNRALGLVAEYGARLAAHGDLTPADAIGQLLNYLPIYAFAGGSMTQLDATDVLDWATAGVGATALAQRWNSPVLVEVNEHTLSKVLEDEELLEKLAQIEDFRALVNNAQHVVTNTKLLKKVKREKGGALDDGERRQQTETAKRRKEIREKLQKFVAKVPVFMYMTDHREQALKHVIESVNPKLFTRVTGLTIEDFGKLNQIGLFHASNMDSAIYQFRSFEVTSLRYAEDADEGQPPEPPVGGWDG